MSEIKEKKKTKKKNKQQQWSPIQKNNKGVVY